MHSCYKHIYMMTLCEDLYDRYDLLFLMTFPEGVMVRDEMKLYWKEHSKEATEQGMMLDEKAEELGQMEIPEILNMLPELTGKRVLDLGAGIG